MRKKITAFLLTVALCAQPCYASDIQTESFSDAFITDERTSDTAIQESDLYPQEDFASDEEFDLRADTDDEIESETEYEPIYANINEYGIMEESLEEEGTEGILTVPGYEITDTETESLVGASAPSSYMSPQGRISDQENRKSCWSFAAMTCAERNLATTQNFSEKHLQYTYFNRDGDTGIPYASYQWYNTIGSMYIPVASMACLLGAADESVYPFQNDALPESAYQNDIAHLREALFLPGYPTSVSEWKTEAWNSVTQRIKTAVMEDGSVWISCKAEGKKDKTEWYEPWTESNKPTSDHAVVIIGWDDAKQINGAEHPGAWYIQNSWGSDWGENGCGWISFEDASLTNPMVLRMEQTEDSVVFSHTGTGYSGIGIGSKLLAYGTNIFTTDKPVIIDKAGFYTNADWNYKVEVIRNNQTVATAEGKAECAGFHKVKLSQPVSVPKNGTFDVRVICQDNDGWYRVLFEGKSGSMRNIVCNEGESLCCLGKDGQEYDCATTTSAAGIDLANKYHSPCIYAYGTQNNTFEIKGAPNSITSGSSFTLRAVYNDKEITPKWTSSVKTVSVSGKGSGTVTTDTPSGFVTITAEYGGIKKQVSILIENEMTETGCYTTPFQGNGPIILTKQNGYYAIRDLYDNTYLNGSLQQSTSPAYDWRILSCKDGYVLQYGKKYLTQNMTLTTNFRSAKHWTLTPSQLDMNNITVSVFPTKAYTGKKITPSVSLKYGNTVLTKNTDYVVTCTNNIAPGTASVTITGKGFVKGTKTTSFIIVKSVSTIVSGKAYLLIPVKDGTKRLTVEKGKTTPNTRIYLNQDTGSESQKFIFTKQANGTYTLTDQKSDFIIGIRNNATSDASFIETQLDAGNTIQRWKLKKQTDGSWSIINAKTNKAIYPLGGRTNAGTYIAQRTYSVNNYQRFYIVETSATPHTYSGVYTIRSAGNNKLSIGIANASLAGGANARLETYNNGKGQKFRLMYSGNGYYRIMSIPSKKVFGIKDNSKTNGANVRQAEWLTQNGQRWKIKKQKDDSVIFESALGTVLNAADIKANANVNSWKSNGKNTQKWKLVKS